MSPAIFMFVSDRGVLTYFLQIEKSVSILVSLYVLVSLTSY